MNRQKIIQYAVLALFGLVGLVGVLALSGGWGLDEQSENLFTATPVVIWGPPFEKGGVRKMLAETKNNKPNVLEKTTYVEKNPLTMYSELLEALATGQGPDAVIIDASMLLPLRDKLSVRTYDSFPLLTFQQTYVEGGEIFTLADGIYAYPIGVDPLVLYWNRDLFTNAGIARVPADWESFLATVPRLTIMEDEVNIRQSAVAFGEYGNVYHAKEILSALFMQTGTSIVSLRDGRYVSDLTVTSAIENTAKAEAATKFYTDFANPIKTVYSWNKTFERSREAFAANKVAMYAGLASETDVIGKINPNLNYAVSVWPQSVTGRNRVTYGKFYGIAVLRSSRNTVGAHTVAQTLAGKDLAAAWQSTTGLPTARRDSLSEVPDNPSLSIAIRSALIARDWLQPDPGGIDDAVQRMVDSVVSGQATYIRATGAFSEDVNTMLDRYNK